MFERYHLIRFVNEIPLVNESVLSDEARVFFDAGKDSADIPPLGRETRAVSARNYRLSGSFETLSDVFFVRDDPALHFQDFFYVHMWKGSYVQHVAFDSLLLSCTFSGEGELTVDGRSYPISAGQAALIDCRKTYTARAVSEDWEHIVVHMWGTAAQTVSDNHLQEGILVTPVSLMDIQTITDGLLDSCMTISEHSGLYVRTSLLNLLTAFFRYSERYVRPAVPDTYRYMIRYMESNYTRDLTLDELSRFANISKYHFSREFKKYTGYTPADYLIRLRIRHACFLLRNTARSIDAITAEVGFHNMANFIESFKKRTGMTPSAYRKNDFHSISIDYH